MKKIQRLLPVLSRGLGCTYTSIDVVLRQNILSSRSIINFGSFRNIALIKLRRTMSTTAERAIASCPSPNFNNSAILQYHAGEERFRLKITLSNGKVFNFDRLVSETASSIKERITTNISKKVKSFNGIVKLFVYEEEVLEEPMENILEKGLRNFDVFRIQIEENICNVDFNPPEIFQMKLLNSAFVGFPIFPVKVETSKNFILEKSKFKWEILKEKSNVVKNKSKKIFKKHKKGSQPECANTSTELLESNKRDCNNPRFVLFPTEDMEGSYLRFTCIPSDGHRFGIPVSVDVPTAVAQSSVSDFVFTERVSRLATKENSFNYVRVVSYNCLADTYATPEWFTFSPASSLEIDYRLPILNKEILSYEGDIVCLQEVDSKYFEGNYQPFLSIQGNFEGAFSSKIGKTREGVATFFNRDKFSIISSDTVVILEHTKTLPWWKSVFSKNPALIERLEDRNTVLQVNVVEPKDTNMLLVVANTHLYFHPDADHIRLIQTVTCVDYVQSLIKRLQTDNPSKRVSLIFCGDFNCTPPFSSFRLLTTGRIEKNDEDWVCHATEKLEPGIKVEHDLNLTNSHPGEELTNITMSFEGCIDYILYQAEHIKLLKTYPPPDKDLLATLTKTTPPKVSLPTFNAPSDHLPLIVDFLLPKV